LVRPLAWLSSAGPSIPSNRGTAGKNGDPSGDWNTPARRGFAIVFLTLVVFGGWASMASIDGAVVAAGSIVVESDRKTVQHLEGGIVQNLLVRGDAHVEEGQVLLCLDPTQERAEEEMARSAVYSAVAEEACLQAEAGEATRLHSPPN
jgi:multidrug efflux pump subunit AcrA (membrane-fusion protein)